VSGKVLTDQPKINIKTGQIIGAEALIRWEHPTKGLIFPGKFISLAENTGLILKLGPFIIKTAAKMINKLNTIGYSDIHISINVSTRQFQKGNLYQDLKQAIANNNINASQLAIEITESVMMEYVDNTLKILDKIKKLNIKICMDDFGTGYSSLAYLKRFSIDSLKIDKTFVDDIQQNGDNKSLLLNAIIVMGHTLNLNIVAEGVEKQYQIDYLEEQDCNIYQGYFFSKPIPEKDFIFLLNNTNTN
jgi:EAL domain-containing protein (putative c-di-GMP-specific phosphodiesterase class I)